VACAGGLARFVQAGAGFGCPAQASHPVASRPAAATSSCQRKRPTWHGGGGRWSHRSRARMASPTCGRPGLCAAAALGANRAKGARRPHERSCALNDLGGAPRAARLASQRCARARTLSHAVARGVPSLPDTHLPRARRFPPSPPSHRHARAAACSHRQTGKFPPHPVCGDPREARCRSSRWQQGPCSAAPRSATPGARHPPAPPSHPMLVLTTLASRRSPRAGEPLRIAMIG
jgi:hypothetical protein